MPPNKALELTGRHSGACEALQPPAARTGDRHAGRPSVGSGSFTGGRQLNALSVGRRDGEMGDAAEFWRWFTANAERFRNLEVPEREALLDELMTHLHAFSEALFFEIGGHPQGPTELIITAEGNPDYFDLARALVSRAPDLPGWEFIALKPAAGFAFVTECAGLRVDPKEMWFLPLQNPSRKLGLRIVGPAYDESHESDFKWACRLLLDGGLGELAAHSEVAHLEVGPVPVNPQAAGYIELTELPQYIAWRHEQLQRGSAT